MSPPLVTVLDCPQSTHGRWHLVYHLRAWPTGTIRSRGWAAARRVYERPMTDAEIAEYRAAARYPCWRYRTWGELREDEARYGVDADALLPEDYR